MSNKITRRAFLMEAGGISLSIPLFGCSPILSVLSEGGITFPEASKNIASPTTGPPKASDVIMRSLRIHPENANDPYDTMQALEEFHATRLEWAYISDADYIKKVKHTVRVFGGAVSSTSYMPLDNDNTWFEKVSIKDLTGTPVIAPWKRTRGRILWGCMNNPELEQGYVRYLKRYIDAGVQVMHRDEPRGNFHCTEWGGCFCSYCMEGFRRYLEKSLNREELLRLGVSDIGHFNYRDYLKQVDAPLGDAFGKWDGGELKNFFVKFQHKSTVNFHKRSRLAMNKIAGRTIPMSCNNLARNWGPIEDVFDWWMGELPLKLAVPGELLQIMAKARKYGKRQVLTMPKATTWQHLKNLVGRTRKTIALSYALGVPIMVPWDIYMPGGTPRYFGRPDQYADLFKFIHANGKYLDKYKAVNNYGISESILTERAGASDGEAAVSEVGTNSEGICVVRCRSDESNNVSQLLHLIDWRDEKKSFKLLLNKNLLSDQKELLVTLITPIDDSASSTTNKEAKIQLTEVSPKRECYEASIPVLDPWGVLLFEHNS